VRNIYSSTSLSLSTVIIEDTLFCVAGLPQANCGGGSSSSGPVTGKDREVGNDS
jgi:hypothetical protein